ncbi:hypothetical protein ALC60_03102 [Trachymyrmex zeteki]|uniref:Uncharacterized protein n=1 Tax=Mycetomoellerius zeteki TaxID=64791 RepID=A0A151XCL3_9HYME|nr:hypothetical protein ALC60_03102 [Trachymyrmex zeteki]
MQFSRVVDAGARFSHTRRRGWCALAGDGGGRVQTRRRATTLGTAFGNRETGGCVRARQGLCVRRSESRGG